jgi:hypothetical protein
MATDRYSERRLKDDFKAVILLNAAMEFRIDEILAAAREDFPGLTWNDTTDNRGLINTTFGGVGFWGGREDLHEPDATKFFSAPGPLRRNWDHVFTLERQTFPDARQAVAKHVSWLEISVRSRGSSLPARFDAARRVTCLAAIFAALPIAVAVYFPAGDTLVPPERWIKAATTTLEPHFPWLEWFGIYANPLSHEGKTYGWTVGTIGMAAFTGHEIVAPKAPVNPGELAEMVLETARSHLERGHQFKDGDTSQLEGRDTIYRIRECAEGVNEMQTDAWVLLHPQAFIDETKSFGARSSRPPPEGMKLRVHGYDQSLAERLEAFVKGVNPPP